MARYRERLDDSRRTISFSQYKTLPRPLSHGTWAGPVALTIKTTINPSAPRNPLASHLPGGTAMRSHLSLVEGLTRHARDRDFAHPALALHPYFVHRARFASYHEGHLFVRFPRDSHAIDGCEFVTLLESGLLRWTLRQH